eukprot:5790058-Amphidinium_carterae.2
MIHTVQTVSERADASAPSVRTLIGQPKESHRKSKRGGRLHLQQWAVDDGVLRSQHLLNRVL